MIRKSKVSGKIFVYPKINDLANAMFEEGGVPPIETGDGVISTPAAVPKEDDNPKTKKVTYVANESTTWNPSEGNVLHIMRNPSLYSREKYIQAVSYMGNMYPNDTTDGKNEAPIIVFKEGVTPDYTSTTFKYGGEVPLTLQDGGKPAINYNTDIVASDAINMLPEVEVNGDATYLVRNKKAYEINNPYNAKEYAMGVFNSNKQQNPLLAPAIERMNKDKFLKEQEQIGYDNWQENAWKFASEQVLLNNPQGDRHRIDYLNDMTAKEEELAKKYNPSLQTTYGADFTRGVNAVKREGYEQLRASLYGVENNNYTEREKQNMLQKYKYIGGEHEGSVLAPLTWMSKPLQALYKDDYTMYDAALSRKNNASMLEDAATDFTLIYGLGKTALNLGIRGLTNTLSKPFAIDLAGVGAKTFSPQSVKGLSKEEGLSKLNQIAETPKSMYNNEINSRKAHLQNLKDKKLIHADTDIEHFSQNDNLTEQLTKDAINNRNTYYRGVDTKSPINSKDLEAMQKAGVDITNKEDVGKYMASHIKIGDLGYSSGFQTMNVNHSALYTSHGFSNYGDMTFKLKKPTDYSKGTYTDWVDELYNYPRYDVNAPYSVDDIPVWARPDKGTNSKVLSDIFVGKKGQKIFEDVSLVTGDFGRNLSSDLPGLTKVKALNKEEGLSKLNQMAETTSIKSNTTPISQLPIKEQWDLITRIDKAIRGKEGEAIIARLNSIEGRKRLSAQFKEANPNLTPTELETLVDNRIISVKDSMLHNRARSVIDSILSLPKAERAKAFNKLDLDSFFPHDNAHYGSESLKPSSVSSQSISPTNLKSRRKHRVNEFLSNDPTAGYITLGERYVYSVPTLDHEVIHAVQKGDPMPLDLEINSLVNTALYPSLSIFKILKGIGDDVKRLSGTKLKDIPQLYAELNYLKTFSNGQEPTAFAAELRSNMLKKGVIDDIYQEITPALLKKAKKVMPFDEDTRLLYIVPSSDYKKLSKSLNKLPALLPAALTLGAATQLKNESEGQPNTPPIYKYGGEVPLLK